MPNLNGLEIILKGTFKLTLILRNEVYEIITLVY